MSYLVWKKDSGELANTSQNWSSGICSTQLYTQISIVSYFNKSLGKLLTINSWRNKNYEFMGNKTDLKKH